MENAAQRARDEWLALRCQAREPGAFADLIAAMERPLFYYAVKLTGRQETALDALQETWLRALRGIGGLQNPAAVRSWLYSIVHGIVVDKFRRDRSRERAEDLHIESAPSDSTPFSPADAAAVHQALDHLDPKYREVLVLHFLEDFSISEIAGIADIPEGTVKSRIHQAKKAMKAVLTGESYAKRT